MAIISSPFGRTPRNAGAGANTYKKGGTTKIAGVMKSGGAMKQGGGRIDRLSNRANKISDRMTKIKEDMPDEGVLPPFAQRYGDKLNKKYARNENRIERVTKKIDTINSKNNQVTQKKGGPITALDQVQDMYSKMYSKKKK